MENPTPQVVTEREMLEAAHAAGGVAVVKTYVKLSGPGWLQSAITLGGGSLASALYLGVVGGTHLLWVQLVAILLGVTMLGAISYVTLSTGESPFKLMRERLNPVLAWGWLLASLMANMIWVLPQYSLAYSAVTQNLLPGMFKDPSAMSSKMTVTLILFVIASAITFCYGKKGRGIVIYEWMLKIMVAAIVLCFMAVSFKIIGGSSGISLGDVFTGLLIPNLSSLSEPVGKLKEAIAAIPDTAVQAYYSGVVVAMQRDIMVSAAATAVGINMTFLLPFSMLNKSWGRSHRGLAIFDLSTGMVIPFVLAVTCVSLAAAATFHGKPMDGILKEEAGIVAFVNPEAKDAKAAQGTINDRLKKAELSDVPVSGPEMKLATMLIKRDTGAFPGALSVLVGERMANLIFGFGVLAMVMSTISMLMLISGFVLCEMLGAEHGGKVHHIGIFMASTGVFWPMIWGGSSGAYLAIICSTFGYILLPVAFVSFFLMMNSRNVLGDQMPVGIHRIKWNVLMLIALILTGLAAGHTALGKTMKIGDSTVPIGLYLVIGFTVAAIIGQVVMHQRHKKAAAGITA